MLTSKVITEIIGNICFKSILTNHEVTYENLLSKDTCAPVAPLSKSWEAVPP